MTVSEQPVRPSILITEYITGQIYKMLTFNSSPYMHVAVMWVMELYVR